MISNVLELFQYEGTKIVTVGMVSGGFILTGKRRDNGKWTNPGGHVDDGEDVVSAAIREVKEEAGIDIDVSQLEFIGAEKVSKGRGGFPFVVFAYLAHVDREKATAKHDPDKEISEWKWVPVSPSSPELQEEVRHAKEDAILIYLGVNKNLEVRMAKNLMEEQSKKIRTAGFEESPPATEGVLKVKPTVPEPTPKTPAEMQNDPDAYLPEEEVTGDAPKDERVPTPQGTKS